MNSDAMSQLNQQLNSCVRECCSSTQRKELLEWRR
jgi:hypothetical protein